MPDSIDPFIEAARQDLRKLGVFGVDSMSNFELKYWHDKYFRRSA